MTNTTLLPAIAGALTAALLVWAGLRFATRAIDRFAARLEREGILDEGAIFAKRLTRFVRSTLWFVALLVAGLVMLRGIGVRGAPRISVEELVAWLMGPGLRLLVIATSAYLAVRVVHFLIDSLQIFLVSRDSSPTDLLERKKRVATLGQLLRVVATLLVIGVATLMALSLFNVDIRPILTGAGIAGLAVGFGAQNLVRDVIAGFFLVLEDQVRVGDVAVVNGTGGLVENVTFRTIVLRDMAGTIHIFPNGSVTTLANMTRGWSGYVVDIDVGYKEDPDRVIAIMRRVAEELRADPAHAALILEPIEIFGVDGFKEGSFVIKARLKTQPIQQWTVGREYRRRLVQALAAEDVDVLPRIMRIVEPGKSLPVLLRQGTATLSADR